MFRVTHSARQKTSEYRGTTWNGFRGVAPVIERSCRLPPAELAIIKEVRRTGIAKKKDDSGIAKELALDGRYRTRIRREQIRRLVCSGVLPENPHNRKLKRFTPKEERYIEKTIEKMKRKKTRKIVCDKIAKKLGREWRVIYDKLQSMLYKKQIPNRFIERRAKPLSKKEKEDIRSIYRANMGASNTRKIARLAAKKVKRDTESVRGWVNREVESKRLPENSGKQKRVDLKNNEFIWMKRTRSEQIKLGLSDTEIARNMTNEKGWDMKKTRDRIKYGIKTKKLEPNPNNQGALLSDDNFTILTQIYQDGVVAGKSNWTIAREATSRIKLGPKEITTKRAFGFIERHLRLGKLEAGA